MQDPSTHADSHALQNFRRSQRHLHHRAPWPHQLASLPAASGRLRPTNSPVSLDQLWVRFFKSFCFLPSHSTGRVVRSGKECALSHLCSLSLQEAPPEDLLLREKLWRTVGLTPSSGGCGERLPAPLPRVPRAGGGERSSLPALRPDGRVQGPALRL